MKTANEKERSSAPVNRPHTPNEILQIKTYYQQSDQYDDWYLRHFHMPSSDVMAYEHVTVFLPQLTLNVPSC
jgi:hypothetical protein